MEQEKREKSKVIIEGNAFYEIDLECMKEQQARQEKEGKTNGKMRREENEKN